MHLATGVGGPGSAGGIRGARILVVDDNAFSAEITAEVLRNSGAIVGIACNGQEALDRLHEASYDCVLMDVQMPVMDGIEATKLIRQKQAWADVPVLALTSNTSAENRDRCLSAGMDDFVGKPFESRLLCTKLSQWVPEAGLGANDAGSGRGL